MWPDLWQRKRNVEEIINKEWQKEMGRNGNGIIFIKGQWHQWSRHVIRRQNDDISRTVLEWKPVGKDLEEDPGKVSR